MQPLFAEFVSGTTSDKWQVCLADCQDYLTYDTLADILYTEYPRQLEQIDVLIVRPRVDNPIQPESIISLDFRPLSKRVPHASLHVLFTDSFEIALSKNLNDLIDDKLPTNVLKTEFVRWLQDKELYSFIKHSRALFQARQNFVYRAPSKRYVNMFLRVGNVQRSRQVLDAFFFWMLPYLRDRSAALTDTWSISSIALNAGRLIEHYWTKLGDMHLQENRTSNNEFHLDMLAAYPDDLLAVMPETQDVLRRISGNGTRNVLILISAVATGASLQRLREAVSQAEIRDEEFSFLALYKLEQGLDIPCLCDISNGVGAMTFTPIQRDEIQGRTVIEIDRSAYFPLEMKETPLLICKEHTAASREFFTEYKNMSAICLHRNSVDLSNQELRHHGVFLDVEMMICHSRFRKRLFDGIGGIVAKPFLIIVPPHSAGKVLAEECRQVLEQKWNSSVPILMSPDLRGIDGPMRDLIGSAAENSELLILDDVSVSGQRLSRYQQSLREMRFGGHITYLVGVARPDNEKNWDRRVKELRFRAGMSASTQHDVICLEKVLLPDWDRRNCPWCAEARALAKLTERGHLGESTLKQVVLRIMSLERAATERGLLDDAIWQPAGAQRPQLTVNSLFMDVGTGPCTQADAIAAVAATIQQMRTAKAEDMRLESTYPHVAVLSPENYLGTRFTDALLRLAILRSANATELELWNDLDEEGRREKVRHFLHDHEERETFMLEFAVARLGNKIPQPFLAINAIEDPGWPADLWRSFIDFH